MGESIWEIKKYIGYVSFEMYCVYFKNLLVIEIVVFGLYDSIGLYKCLQESQMVVCEWWMDVFGIVVLKDKFFFQLLSGEQCLVLLVCVFVKDLELFILDELLYGFDMYNCWWVKKIIEVFCCWQDKMMIMVIYYELEFFFIIIDCFFLKRNC